MRSTAKTHFGKSDDEVTVDEQIPGRYISRIVGSYLRSGGRDRHPLLRDCVKSRHFHLGGYQEVPYYRSGETLSLSLLPNDRREGELLLALAVAAIGLPLIIRTSGDLRQSFSTHVARARAALTDDDRTLIRTFEQFP